MKIDNFQKLAISLMVSVIVLLFSDMFLGNGTILVGGLLGVACFNFVYSSWENRFDGQDILLFVTVIMISSISSLILKGICLCLPSQPVCSPNQFLAILFSNFSSPFVCATILWIFYRLPRIVKRMVDK